MDSPLPPDPYNTLGLTKDASPGAIKSAYRKLALRFHPDKCTEESEKAQNTDKFHEVQQAFNLIGDEDKRARYDALIRLAELRAERTELMKQHSFRAKAPEPRPPRRYYDYGQEVRASIRRWEKGTDRVVERAFAQCEEQDLNNLKARLTALEIKAKGIALEASFSGITPASTYIQRPPSSSTTLFPASKNSLSPSISTATSRSTTSETQSSVSTSATSYASTSVTNKYQRNTIFRSHHSSDVSYKTIRVHGAANMKETRLDLPDSRSTKNMASTSTSQVNACTVAQKSPQAVVSAMAYHPPTKSIAVNDQFKGDRLLSPLERYLAEDLFTGNSCKPDAKIRLESKAHSYTATVICDASSVADRKEFLTDPVLSSDGLKNNSNLNSSQLFQPRSVCSTGTHPGLANDQAFKIASRPPSQLRPSPKRSDLRRELKEHDFSTLSHELEAPVEKSAAAHPLTSQETGDFTAITFDDCTQSDTAGVDNHQDESDRESSIWTELSDSVPDESLDRLQQFRDSAAVALEEAFIRQQKNIHQCPREQDGSSYSVSSAQTTNNGSASSSSTSPSNNGKRKRNDRGDGEDTNRRPSQRRSSPGNSTSSEIRLLACPFSKFNPRRYCICQKYILKEISRLKQHLDRCHRIPPHCSACSHTFDSESERQDHERERSCEVLSKKTWDGVNEQQKELLKRRVSSKKGREENWYIIYEILFPGSPRPSSPYIEIELSEELLAFQHFIAAEGSSVVQEVLRSQLPSALWPVQEEVESFTQSLVPQIMDLLFERWQRDGGAMYRPPVSTDVGLPAEPLVPAILTDSGDLIPDPPDQSYWSVLEDCNFEMSWEDTNAEEHSFGV